MWRLNSARPSRAGHSTILLRSEIPSGMCAKLRTVAASNNRDHARNLSYYCLLALHIKSCYSSRTSRSWWITQSTQHHRRGCNSVKSEISQVRNFAWLRFRNFSKLRIWILSRLRLPSMQPKFCPCFCLRYHHHAGFCYLVLYRYPNCVDHCSQKFIQRVFRMWTGLDKTFGQ